jgi:hypothetical protein
MTTRWLFRILIRNCWRLCLLKSQYEQVQSDFYSTYLYQLFCNKKDHIIFTPTVKTRCCGKDNWKKYSSKQDNSHLNCVETQLRLQCITKSSKLFFWVIYFIYLEFEKLEKKLTNRQLEYLRQCKYTYSIVMLVNIL